MARSDLILSLVRAATQGNAGLLRQTVEALIAEERAKQHHVLADRLAASLVQNREALPRPTLNGDAAILDLLAEITPRVTLDDLILQEAVASQCRDLVEEHQRADLLRSHGLEPRHRVLLTGPPGNGKTSLAEAIASTLMVPLLRVRYDGVVGSFLGETASRLRRIFDYIRSRQCVLFFDEFDTIGKERGDREDVGEIKRVVSSLLLQIDDLPSYVTVVAATNHPELLDRAAWRRFQIRLELPIPTPAQRAEWFIRLERQVRVRFGRTPEQLARAMEGASFSELRDFGDDVMRRWILAQPSGEMAQIIGEQLERRKVVPPVPSPR